MALTDQQRTELDALLRRVGDGCREDEKARSRVFCWVENLANPSAERQFAMQDGPSIPWSLAEKIYAENYEFLHPRCQTLEHLHEIGGFSWREVSALYRADNDKRGVAHFGGSKP